MRFPDTRLRLLAALICAAAPHCQLDAQTSSEVKPPFGLVFGQTSDAVRAVLEEGQVEIEDVGDIDGNLKLTATRLPQQTIESAVMTFDRNQLAAVELVYRHPDWNASRYRTFYSQVRQNISSKFGTGSLIAKSQSEDDDGLLETLMGHEWRMRRTMLQLYYYSASCSEHTFFSVSIHYKTI